MENKVSISLVLDANLPAIPTVSTKETAVAVAVANGNSASFVNQAAIVWQDTRKKWVGDALNKPRRPPTEPIISWCTTYEDLLSGSQHFPQPIPLSEMVDFLVDIWHEEGLYD